MPSRSIRVGIRLVWTSLILGLVHAFWSFYWAFGGAWMLDTVGQWAVVSQLEQPVETILVLLGIGSVKTAAAIIPVAVEYGKLGGGASGGLSAGSEAWGWFCMVAFMPGPRCGC